MTRTAMTLAALLCLPSTASAAAPLPRVGAWAPESSPVTSSPAPPVEIPVQRPTAAPPPPSTAPPPVTSAPPPPSSAPPPVTSAPPPPSSAPPPVTSAPPPPVGEPVVGPEPPPESAPVEVAPAEPAPVEVDPVAPPPYEIEPIEPLDELEPAPYRSSISPPPLAGAGMRTGGGILVGSGGLTVLTGLVVLAVSESFGGDPFSRGISAAIILVGGAEIGGGVGLIVPGIRKSRELREWEAQHSIDAPKAGYGMIVGGSVLVGAGGLNMISAAVNTGVTGEVPVANLVIGIGELGAGAALLTVGTKRRKAYRDWEQSHFGTPSLSLLPGGGMAVGLSGRF